MDLSAQTIREFKSLNMIVPFVERSLVGTMSYGVSSCGYDIRIKQSVTIWPVNLQNLVNNWFADLFPNWFNQRPSFILASSIERFEIPCWIKAELKDKSSLIRKGLSVHNTVIEPGWKGYLTLELKNNGDKKIELKSGNPIGQMIFTFLDKETDQPYIGKYQNQENKPVKAR